MQKSTPLREQGSVFWQDSKGQEGMPETKQVKCVDCRGIMNLSVMLLQLERGGMVLIFEDVPCLECSSCGQQEIPGAIAEEISTLAEYFVEANQTVRRSRR